jgi:pimeloyl-ACP methyl ester carboxylesterase
MGRSQKVTAGGHTFGIAEYGDAGGKPIFYFHGFAGSRLQIPPSDELGKKLGLRIIAVDRPGMGLSSPIPRQTLLEYGQCFGELANALGLGRWSIVAWSAGGAYALACASALPERVTGLSLIAPMSKWFVGPGATRHASLESKSLALLARFAPFLLYPVVGRIERATRTAPATFAKQLQQIPELDRQTITQTDIQAMLIASLPEAFRQGGAGVVEEIVRISLPWQFDSSAIKMPIWIWQGSADTVVLPALSQELANSLPQTRYVVFPGEGHFSLFRHWEEILLPLAELP